MSIIPNDRFHKVLRYVLKIGDIEEAAHVFLDLLEMTVISHEEYDTGSEDGEEVHYTGRWTRTVVGYSTDIDPMQSGTCLQLTKAYGIEQYSRGNFLEAIEIRVSSKIIKNLEDAGIQTQTFRGELTYVLECDGYHIQVVKSRGWKNCISRIILNCDDALTLNGPTVSFWTSCLGFEVSHWSSHPTVDKNAHLMREKSVIPLWLRLRIGNVLCCPTFRKRRKLFKPLEKDEEPYVELQFGSTDDFTVRLQMITEGKTFNVGTGHEKLMLTCLKESQAKIEDRVKIIGKRLGGSGQRRSFQLLPGNAGILGVVATDTNGLEILYYSYEDIKDINLSQLDAELAFRQFVAKYKAKKARPRFEKEIYLMIR